MNPYIQFVLKGINGISVMHDEHTFTLETNDNKIESVELLLDNMEIAGLQVNFQSDVIFDTSFVDRIKKWVELFVINIVGNLDANVRGLEISVGNIHNPNSPPSETLSVLSSSIYLTTSISREIICYPIDRYKGLFKNVPNSENKQDAYFLLSNIMKIDNIAVRYLMQYEFLMSLVAPNRKQKEVKKFIKKKYNDTLSFNRIGVHKTRKDGKTYYEDDITYYRNILAHNNSTEMPDDIERIIRDMSKAATRIIIFAINQQP